MEIPGTSGPHPDRGHPKGSNAAPLMNAGRKAQMKWPLIPSYRRVILPNVGYFRFLAGESLQANSYQSEPAEDFNFMTLLSSSGTEDGINVSDPPGYKNLKCQSPDLTIICVTLHLQLGSTDEVSFLAVMVIKVLV
jgi:hypothetical protein